MTRMMKAKYEIEGAFIPVAQDMVLLRPSELYHLTDDQMGALEHFHLYAICSRIRCRAVRAYRHVSGDWVVDVELANGDELLVPCGNAVQDPEQGWLGADDFTVTVVDGGASVLFEAVDHPIQQLPLSELIRSRMTGLTDDERGPIDRVLDLKVEYVGQSFGKEGDRQAVERLLNHKTFQRILVEIPEHTPNREVVVILFAFTGYDKIGAIGPWGVEDHGVPIEEQVERLLAEDYDLRVTTNVAEATLIRYFSPVYNTMYRERFPARNHVILETPYARDVNSIGVDFNTVDLGVRMCSEVVEPSWVHAIAYPLHSREERMAMFEFFAESVPDFVAPTDEGNGTSDGAAF
jgi:hypothetical protein